MQSIMNTMVRPESTIVSTIQTELLHWYARYQRDLPWRKDQDPYKVWVSEIMLQQTRVNTVIPYFNRFIERFPTITDLANASDDDVVKMWEGLGYYSRVRNLHSAVKEVADKYGGKVPDQVEEISRLKGIGPYTAGAILSIAYQKKVPAVDGNVMRVYSRLFALYDDIALPATRKKMEAIGEVVIPEHAPGDFNQALMELGATICTPTSPQCLFCPVSTVCEANEQGLQDELPQKKKAKAPTPVLVRFAWIESAHSVFLVKRPDKGLLAGMWSLPTFDQEDPSTELEEYLFSRRWTVQSREVAAKIDHVFSHRHWFIEIERIKLDQVSFECGENEEWIDINSIHQKAFPNVYRKAISVMKKQ
ncbi:A/G-specific DNA-adenine glycosylase [Thermoactinomyces sp. DSM 45891]|uniref:A/G-specific adenine glycosylase n=1 Tax=Thermoactinomyces sp. DSM 45891 TaxID=1761907 RepID=UPI00091DBBE0|nr:A/G-specific adenine glycosylase [Thermoactinomyces sp. DSM 45891]SFX67831.1 A/G-specific DNA-adenine glycosylase [Thermoactinomyces sp. DSM 45891]